MVVLVVLPEGSLRVDGGIAAPPVTLLDTVPTLITVLCPFDAGVFPCHHHHLTVCDDQDVITHRGE